MKEYKFVNIENDELLTLEDLKKFYDENNDCLEYSFNDYLSNCMVNNNGSLEAVEKLTDTFYKSTSGTCYSANKYIVSGDVNSELSDLYFDNAVILDEIAQNIDIHTFEELIDNYYNRLDNLNHDEIQKQLCVLIESNYSKDEFENLVKLLIDSTFFE